MIRLSDVRYALRLWRWHPAMVVLAGLSLGLGGATTTMYGVVKASAWPSGARAHDVVAMLMAQSLKPIGIGVVLGVAGGLSRALNSMFWRMTSVDPLVRGASQP